MNRFASELAISLFLKFKCAHAAVVYGIVAENGSLGRGGAGRIRYTPVVINIRVIGIVR